MKWIGFRKSIDLGFKHFDNGVLCNGIRQNDKCFGLCHLQFFTKDLPGSNLSCYRNKGG